MRVVLGGVGGCDMNQPDAKQMADDFYDVLVELIGTERTSHCGMQDYILIGDDINRGIDLLEKWGPYK